MTEAYDVICSIADLIDKLCIENIKVYDSRKKALEERSKPNPDFKRISELEWRVTTSGEQRVRLRDEINKRLNEAIKRGGFKTAPEVRTFELK